MPSKNGVGRHERCQVAQYGPSEPLAEHGQRPSLRIVQPQSTSDQLCFQCTILLAKKRNHITLLALEPAKQRREQHLQRNHTVSLRECVVRVFRHYAPPLEVFHRQPDQGL